MPVTNGKYRKTFNPYAGYYGWTRKYANGNRKFHGGVDIIPSDGNIFNAPVYSIDAGEVILAEDTKKAYGKLVVIKHNIDGAVYYSYYAHLNIVGVKVGQKVVRTEYIGNIGHTGNADENDPHLHLEIRNSKKQTLHPAPFIGMENTPEKFLK
jgi:murein DD-endopeptidase MepM/ murein hydrolase activator NlpD